jgi:hypothetical protein
VFVPLLASVPESLPPPHAANSAVAAKQSINALKFFFICTPSFFS